MISESPTKFSSPSIDLSYSRKGNCFDNACMENFYGHLKSEAIYQMPKTRHYILPRSNLKHIIDKYIRWYNKERIQENLGYLSPVNFLNFKQQEIITNYINHKG
ncbi:hypothetical protein DWW46_02825 [Sutterella sp. AF15-45LB]|nr:hypothetical protein DWW46_02825 [Sutterella sp. AF15-45LB]RGU80574.1 hypothetical protein DWW45_02825 [Sutterella sp. AF15-44LB]